ncbi:MAG TPA: TonB-dependent receptor [Caulobacteraceae bacterium]|nr:TonB-dependent receptor [Caulobacteraceae bacterium]
MTYQNRRSRRVVRVRLAILSAVSVAALAAATSASAADAAAAAGTGDVISGADYGVRVDELVVTAQSLAVTEAPVKAPLQSTEPTSIIDHNAIDQMVAQTGDYTSVLQLAPSMAGLSFNGPGLYEAKTTLRGFSDGQYNVTYDGIPFADTNDPTHHSTSFFPSSNIGAVSVERGPGAAGQLGQANFGGSVNIFSPEVGDEFGASEQVTYGSWNTFQSLSLLNTGKIAKLNDSRFLLAVSGLRTDGYLTNSGAYGLNVMMRGVVPLSANWKATVFASLNHTHVYQDDNNGATLAQVALYGKRFALTDIPNTNTYYLINQVNKHTDFEYVRLDGDVGEGMHVENTTYTYYYDNQTLSPKDVTCYPNCAAGDVTHPTTSTTAPGHIPGYTKLNHYRVIGDILRINQEIPIGMIKAGVWVEHAGTHRFRYDWDLTADINPTVPDFGEKAVKDASGTTISTAPANINFDQHSSIKQIQPFVDLELHPVSQLTVTPGFKWLSFTRDVSGPYNQKTRNANAYSATWEKPLYFLTANWRLRDDWSVYGQFATGFLAPPLSTLQVNNPNTADVKPQQTRNYQVGTVYQGGRLTVDADLYWIDFDNLIQSFVCKPGMTGCTVNDTVYFNGGGATYKGVEGAASLSLTPELFVFANGSINIAESKTPPHRQISGAPRGTAAFGVIFRHGGWKVSLSDKYVAEQWANDYDTTDANTARAQALYDAFRIDGYNSTDLSVTYTIGRVRLQGAVYNLFDSQQAVKISTAGAATYDTGTGAITKNAFDQYYYQPGRNFQLSAKVSF